MKTNEEKIETLEKTSVVCNFLWLASLISWIVLTFFVNSNVGMWVSLSFMWLFLLLDKVIKKAIAKKKIQNYPSDENMIV